MSFTHLHVHTDYSVDGIAQIGYLFSKAERLGMPGLAITDHGTMAGVPLFLNYASRFPSVKPIVGCEFFLEKDGRLYHLILLAKNYLGYQNLLKLCSSAHKEKNDDRPRITHESVVKFHENLICTSACLGGEIPQAILEGYYEKAKRITSWYKDLFGDDFYLEVALHKGGKRIQLSEIDNQEAYLQSNKELVTKQRTVANGIFRLSKELDIKVVVTNDVHFVEKEDAIVHDAYLCHIYHKRIENPARIRYSHLEYLRSEKEMLSLFPNHPEVVSNTQDILDKIETYSIKKKVALPHIYDNPKEVLSIMVYNGAEIRYGKPISSEVQERLKQELEFIDSTGNNDYFLLIKYIVDILRNEHGIIIGPGRGASTSSLVNYCLGITEVDPLQFGLLYERFLWTRENSFPQIDLDIEDSRRKEAISILQERFGNENVALLSYYESLSNTRAWNIVSKAYNIPNKTRQKIMSIKSRFSCQNICNLKILNVIKETLEQIVSRHQVEIDIKQIPLNDDKTLNVFISGDTSDIFMFQSDNLRKLLKDFKPSSFTDLVLINAMYRPGLMDKIPQLLARKQGEEKVTYEIQELEPILKESYGILSYQEQLIRIAQCMGLIAEDVQKFRDLVQFRNITHEDVRDRFIEGGINLGHSKEAMMNLFTRLYEDGNLTFNKSHSVSYTLIAWRCAWLKAHFREEYVQTYNNLFQD